MAKAKYMRLRFLYFLIFIFLLALTSINIKFDSYINESNHVSHKESPLLSDSNPLRYNWNITWGYVGDDECHAISVDSIGNIYGAGVSKVPGTDWDMSLVKFTSSGEQIWNRTYAGPLGTDQRFEDMVLDPLDNVYAVGSVEPINALNSYVALYKLNSSGDLQWKNENYGAGGNTFNHGYGVILDTFGNIYVTGSTSSYGIGGDDICLIKYNTSGSIEWSTTWGKLGNDNGMDIVLDLAGNIYVVGYTFNSVDNDICLIKFDNSGNELWNKTWDGSNDAGFSLALDSSENIIIGGMTSTDSILLKYSNAGIYQWNITSGFGLTDRGEDVLIDSLNYIYLAGAMTSNYFDMYLIKYDEDGNKLWDYFWGGNDFETCLALTVDAQSHILLAGVTKSYGEGDEDFSIVNLTILPQLIIKSPTQNDLYGSVGPNFNLTIIVPNLNTTWYTIDSGNTNITFTGNVGQINQTEWNKKGDEPVTIRFYANDTFGEEGFVEIIIFKDISVPQIYINKPSPNQLVGIIPPSFNVDISDLNLDSMWYTLDSGLNNYTFTDNGTINPTAWAALLDGLVKIIFYANDTIGHLASAEVNIIKDTQTPTIIVNSPEDDDVFGTSAPSFNLTITDDHLNTTWYTLDGGLNNYTFTDNGTINPTAWAALLDGLVKIIFYANDSVGHLASAEVNIIKDTQTPTIIVNSPEDNDIFGSSAPSFNIRITDDNLDSMWYTLDGGLNNYTFTDNETINPTAWAALLDGPIEITFHANDLVGHLVSAEVNIIKDTSPPIITIISPSNNDVFGSDSPSFEISIDEANLINTWYTLDQGLTNLTFSRLIGTIDQTVWDSTSQGSIQLKFYAEDIANKVAYKEVVIIKSISTETKISGFDLGIILITLGIISITFIKKFKKFNF